MRFRCLFVSPTTLFPTELSTSLESLRLLPPFYPFYQSHTHSSLFPQFPLIYPSTLSINPNNKINRIIIVLEDLHLLNPKSIPQSNNQTSNLRKQQFCINQFFGTLAALTSYSPSQCSVPHHSGCDQSDIVGLPSHVVHPVLPSLGGEGGVVVLVGRVVVGRDAELLGQGFQVLVLGDNALDLLVVEVVPHSVAPCQDEVTLDQSLLFFHARVQIVPLHPNLVGLVESVSVLLGLELSPVRIDACQGVSEVCNLHFACDLVQCDDSDGG